MPNTAARHGQVLNARPISNRVAELAKISIVIPCYNEADGIGYLKSKLMPVLDRLSRRHSIELVFVDDGSTDDTAAQLRSQFGDRADTIIVSHEQNMNLGAAIRTGAVKSTGEWIANLDSDCSYDPAILEPMIAEMEAGADLVTASAYHPNGRVVGVPGFRLGLSKAAVVMYRVILRSHVHTFSCMVRVYRREIYDQISSPLSDFTAVPEMMLKAIQHNLRVSEVPAELSVRQFGQSKMRVAKVIAGHLQLMARLIFNPRSFR